MDGFFIHTSSEAFYCPYLPRKQKYGSAVPILEFSIGSTNYINDEFFLLPNNCAYNLTFIDTSLCR